MTDALRDFLVDLFYEDKLDILRVRSHDEFAWSHTALLPRDAVQQAYLAGCNEDDLLALSNAVGISIEETYENETYDVSVVLIERAEGPHVPYRLALST